MSDIPLVENRNTPKPQKHARKSKVNSIYYIDKIIIRMHDNEKKILNEMKMWEESHLRT